MQLLIVVDIEAGCRLYDTEVREGNEATHAFQVAS